MNCQKSVMRKLFSVIILLFFTGFVSAQGTWNSFWQLSGPEKCWVLSHPFIANKARKLTIVADSTSRYMKKNGMLDGDISGGQIDAFRHAYWMAIMSQNFCWKKAIALGKAHEKGNFNQFKKGRTDEESSLPDSISGVMDLFNNEAGARIGCQNKDLGHDSLKELISNEIRNGKMKIILKNKNGDFTDCDGNIIDLKLYLKRWNVPKCIVKSDVERR